MVQLHIAQSGALHREHQTYVSRFLHVLQRSVSAGVLCSVLAVSLKPNETLTSLGCAGGAEEILEHVWQNHMKGLPYNVETSRISRPHLHFISSTRHHSRRAYSASCS